MARDEDVKNEKSVTAEKQKQVDASQKIKDLADALDIARRKTVAALKEDIAGMERQAALYEKLGSSEDAKALRAEHAAEIEKTKLRLLEEQIAKGEIQGPQAMELLKTQKAQVEQAEHLVEKINNATEAIREGRAAAEQLGDTLSSGLVGGDLMSLFNVNNITKMIKALKGGEASIGSFVKSFGIGLVVSFATKLIELAVEVDKVESGFKRATGASDDMARSLTENFEETRRLGVSLEEMSASMQSLYNSFTDFTMISRDAQQEVAKTGALLAEVGVSADDFAKGMQLSTKAFGLTAEGATAAARDIADFATIIGVTPQQLGSDFANVGTSLAKMGDQGVRAFKDLAIVSKITGLEMGKLLQITDKFDTFEGAAEQAGKLNAALGGNFVNAMDLMMATDPADRFNQIRDAILDTGLTFDDMSYYQRKFYTDALGLSDVSDLAAMLSGDMSNLEGTTRKSSAEYAKLAERTKQIQSLTDSFKNLIADLTPILTDVVDGVRDWMESLENSPARMEEIKEAVKSFADALVSVAKGIIFAMENWEILVTAWAAFKIAGLVADLSSMGEALGGVGGVAEDFADTMVEKVGDAAAAAVESGTDALADGIANIGEKAEQSSKGLIAVGIAVALIGGGIYFAATGVAELVAAFSGLGDAAPWAALGLGIFMVAMVAMVALLVYFGPALAGAGAALIAFGAAVGLMGLGIMLAAKGLASMATSFGQMFSAIDLPKMTAFKVFMVVLAANAMAIGLAGRAVKSLSSGIGEIIGSLSQLPQTEMTMLTNFMTSMASLETGHMTEIAEGIKKINTELEKVPENKALALKTTMELATVNQATAGLAATTRAITDAIGGLFGDRGAGEKLAVNVEVSGDVLMEGRKVGKFVKKEVGKIGRDGVRGTG